MKRVLSSVLACLTLLSVLALFSACGQNSHVTTAYAFSEEKTDYVLMSVEGYGDILIQLEPDYAPITVRNFKDLVASHFYDGLTFHRVMSGFMIQGGDPNGDGTGGSENLIKGEFTANGVDNQLKHVRGTISMARGSYSMDSASCQFFIVHETSQRNTASLDGRYAAFGEVIDGMDTVDAIAACEVTYRGSEKSKPVNSVTITSVRFVTLK